MSIEARIETIEDNCALRELKSLYCWTLDGRKWKEWAGLFTEDARLTVADRTTYNERDEIHEFARDVIGEQFEWSVTKPYNAVIDISGDDATGNYFFDVVYGRTGGVSGWVTGQYDETYRRVNETWKIASLDISYIAANTVLRGRNPFAQEGSDNHVSLE